MARPEIIPLLKHITYDQLLEHIRTEKSARILKKLYFIKYRYEGMSISESSKLLSVASIMGRRWQKRWNEAGYEGLKPRYRGGRPSKLTQQQKDQLIQILKSRNVWTT
ncbi:MAG: helix-turn-helix domain-containing protein, partial [Methanohalobium sp.]|uniref:helix-turn-helix domain-containing protein n=1 Tax=Methanohalobium sp. TaxID=2837493 RepID=UPI00397DAA41